MEYADGGNLCSYVKRRKRLDEGEAQRIFQELLEGVSQQTNERPTDADLAEAPRAGSGWQQDMSFERHKLVQSMQADGSLASAAEKKRMETIPLAATLTLSHRRRSTLCFSGRDSVHRYKVLYCPTYSPFVAAATSI